MRNLVLIAMLLSMGSLLAQDAPEGDLRIESSFWKQDFYQDTTHYKLSELIDLFEFDAQAHELIRKANNQHDLALFCQISGGFLALYPFFNDAIGREPNYNMSFIGLGLVGLSIPLEIGARHKATQAVMRYNHQQKKSLKASLLLQPQGLGLSLRF